jgi:hypothetical protein
MVGKLLGMLLAVIFAMNPHHERWAPRYWSLCHIATTINGSKFRNWNILTQSTQAACLKYRLQKFANVE